MPSKPRSKFVASCDFSHEHTKYKTGEEVPLTANLPVLISLGFAVEEPKPPKATPATDNKEA